MTATTDLQALCERSLQRDGQLDALEFEGRWHTWGELQGTAQRLRWALATSGVGPDAAIGFVPRNHPSAIAALIALISEGRSISMIYAFQSPAAIARDVLRLKPAALVAAPEDLTPEVKAVLQAENIVAIAIDGAQTEAQPGVERANQSAGIEATEQPRIEILTSGTTGPPKQFAITYDMLSVHLVRAPQALREPDCPDDVPPSLLYFPLGNISGLYTTLPSLLRGQRAVLLERFSIPAWRDYVVRYRPAHSGIPPASLQMMLDANIPAEDLASIKTMGFGAAPLDPSAQRAFEERYGIPVLLSYGATEFGGPVTLMSAELHAEFGQSKFGSVGRPFGGAKIRVVDPVTNAELPFGQEGILEVVSPRIGPDWIRTSDIAMIDTDGFLYHRGRADGAIVRGGFKVLPETIEKALLLYPAVAAASVVGIASHRLGEVPAAAIQPSPVAQSPTSAELELHLRNLLPATHIPVEWCFVEELPKTPSMKIDRPAVQRLFDKKEAENAGHAA